MAKRDLGITLLILLLLGLLGAAGEFNYQRNKAAEEPGATRRYQGYADAEIATLIAAYEQEVEALEARYGEARRRKRIETKSGGLIDEQIGEFERAQRASASTRSIGAEAAKKEAILRELRKEQLLRADRMASLKFHLRRLVTI